MGNKNAQERVFLSRARSLYIKALRQTQGVGAAQTQQAQQAATSAPMGAFFFPAITEIAIFILYFIHALCYNTPSNSEKGATP